ncbi:MULTISPECIES: hypothetical protein [unclassified Rhodococcus (in: high G+C Gram-positive bacteria)]|nr:MULTISPECIES: hypothetical protein [unclassified Rhodococcus (in: high G+C Gram-positive bacteria)]
MRAHTQPTGPDGTPPVGLGKSVPAAELAEEFLAPSSVRRPR